MLVTITEFNELAKDDNGQMLPLGEFAVGRQEMTAVGESDALGAGARFVRIATDTAIKVDGDLFMPGVEFVACVSGAVLTIEAAG